MEWKRFSYYSVPAEDGWYYVTCKFVDSKRFSPTADIKLVGLAYYYGNDRKSKLSDRGFYTIDPESHDGLFVGTKDISDIVIAFAPIDFPEASTLPDQPTEEEMKALGWAEVENTDQREIEEISEEDDQ